MIAMILDIEPVAKGRPRLNRNGHAYTPKKTRDYEAEMQKRMRAEYKGQPLTGPLLVTLFFYLKEPKRKVREYPTCKPDVDNLIKPIKDAGNGILWVDDSQVVQMTAGKFYGGKPKVTICVEEVES